MLRVQIYIRLLFLNRRNVPNDKTNVTGLNLDALLLIYRLKESCSGNNLNDFL